MKKAQQRRTNPFHPTPASVQALKFSMNPMPALIGQPVQHAWEAVRQRIVIAGRMEDRSETCGSGKNQKRRRQCADEPSFGDARKVKHSVWKKSAAEDPQSHSRGSQDDQIAERVQLMNG